MIAVIGTTFILDSVTLRWSEGQGHGIIIQHEWLLWQAFYLPTIENVINSNVHLIIVIT